MLGEAARANTPKLPGSHGLGTSRRGSVHGRLRSDWTAGSRIHWKLLEMAGPALSSAEMQGTPGEPLGMTGRPGGKVSGPRAWGQPATMNLNMLREAEERNTRPSVTESFAGISPSNVHKPLWAEDRFYPWFIGEKSEAKKVSLTQHPTDGSCRTGIQPRPSNPKAHKTYSKTYLITF